MKYGFIGWLLFAGLAVSSPLLGQVVCIDPSTWPETIQVGISGDQTSLTLGPPVSAVFTVRSLSRTGNVINVDLSILNSCNVIPIPARTFTIQVGALEPGSYILRVVNNGFPGGPHIVERPFVVAGFGAGGAASVPVFSFGGLSLLALLMLVLAKRGMR